MLGKLSWKRRFATGFMLNAPSAQNVGENADPNSKKASNA